MLKFGVIAEGPTDQTVIENILLGYFEDQEDEPDIQSIQPPRPLTRHRPAGWTLVFKSLERKDHEGALQYNDYLVIHIDTDVQEEPGFDVPRREGGKRTFGLGPSRSRHRQTQSRHRRRVLPGQRTSNSVRDRGRHDRVLAPCRCSTTTKRPRRLRDVLKRRTRSFDGAGTERTVCRGYQVPRAYDQASRRYPKRQKLMNTATRIRVWDSSSSSLTPCRAG